jgi:hypothetical protein
VLLCEEEKEKLQKVNRELAHKNAALEREVASLRADLKARSDTNIIAYQGDIDDDQDNDQHDGQDDDREDDGQYDDPSAISDSEPVFSLEQLAAADNDIRSVLVNAKSQIFELARASQTQVS